MRWALLLLALARSAVAAEPPRLALVVAESAYQALPALPACQASAAIVAASLNRAGWTVTLLRDPSNGQLGGGIATFADALAKAPGATALVYACGYAAAFENRLFLLPASARLARETDALTEGVVLPALTGAVLRAELRAGLVVADLVALPGKAAVPAEAAARRGSVARSGLLVATAASGGPDGPTPTAAALAQALAESNLSVANAQSMIGGALAAAGARAFVQPPAEEAWLIGGPAPVVVTAPDTPEPPAAPPSPIAAAAPAAPPAPVEPPAPAAPEPPPAPSPPAVASTPSGPAKLGDLDRRRVQLALQRLGYYAGRVDGTFGSESLAAIRRYQHELGGEMNGRLTEEQAARLLATP